MNRSASRLARPAREWTLLAVVCVVAGTLAWKLHPAQRSAGLHGGGLDQGERSAMHSLKAWWHGDHASDAAAPGAGQMPLPLNPELTSAVRTAADQTIEVAIMAEDLNDRLRAIQSLETTPRELALAALTQILQSGESELERRAAVAALLRHGLQGDPGGFVASALSVATKDVSPGVSGDATYAIAQLSASTSAAPAR